MDVITSLSIVALAALIHASFQLSVGVLSLMSGHALGAKKSRSRLMYMVSGYTIGAGVMTLLILSFTSLMLLYVVGDGEIPLTAWALVCGLALGIGVAVWLFYYKRGKDSTQLWIPRAFARHLDSRSKATHYGVEAFSLGMTSVIAEAIFIIPSIALTALVLFGLPSSWQLVGIGLYTVISLIGLFIAWVFIGKGSSLAKMQRWRAENKKFLQFAAGSALIVLGFFVYVSEIMTVLEGGY